MSYLQKLRLASVAAAMGVAHGSLQALEPEDFLVFNWKSLTVKPRFSTAASYSDNIFYGNNKITVPVPGPAGSELPIRVEAGGFISMFSPGIQLQLGQSAGDNLLFGYTHDEVLYDYFEDDLLRRVKQLSSIPTGASQDRFDFVPNLRVGKFSINGASHVNLLSSFLGGGNTVSLQLVDRLEMQNQLRITYDISEKTDVYINGVQWTYDYSGNVNIYDVNEYILALGGTYKFSEKLGVFVEGFNGQSAIGANSNLPKAPHSEIAGGFVGLRGVFTPKTEGTVKVGYESRTFPGDRPSNDAVAVSGQVSWMATPRTRLRLGYDRRTYVSLQLAEQVSVGDYITTDVSQTIGSTGMWQASLGLRYNLGDVTGVTPQFAGTPPARVVYPKSESTEVGMVARVSYRPRPWLGTSLAYEYEVFDSSAVYYFERLDPATGVVSRTAQRPYLIDYGNHRVTLRVELGF